MINCVALDLETATSVKSSICQIGITEVINGVPQESKSWFVQPEGNEYDFRPIAHFAGYNYTLSPINTSISRDQATFRSQLTIEIAQ